MDLPGLEKEDVNARVENNHVIVSGERKSDSINNNFYGKFEQIFKIPENVKVDKIKASLKNGVLNITFPKDKNAIGKEIDIKIS